MVISRRKLVLVSLVLSTCIVPKLSLFRLPYYKSVNVTIEDMILLLALLYYIPVSLRGCKLKNALLLYYLIAFVSTVFGLAMGYLNPIRAWFFFAKEFEFLLLFMLIRKIAQDRSSIKATLSAFLFAALINGFYAVYQVVTGNIGAIPDAFVVDRVQYYGIRTFAVFTPTVVGNYFGLVAIVSFSLIFHASSRWLRVVSAICLGFALVGVIMSFSRSAIFGGWAGLSICGFIILLKSRPRSKIIVTVSGVVIIVFVTALMNYYKVREFAPIFRITKIGSFLDQQKGTYYSPSNTSEFFDNVFQLYAGERFELIQKPILKIAFINPIFGLGKSCLGGPIEGIETFGEAHNYFLRIFVEMGIFGLITYIYLLLRILWMGIESLRRSIDPLDKSISLVCIGMVVCLSATSFAQDALLSIKTATLFWLFLGLMDGRQKWAYMSVSSSPVRTRRIILQNA